jgi:hypothetical protein
MDAIIVGDLHGNVNFYHRVKHQFPKRNIILLGDLLDSFLYGVEDQVKLLTLVLNDIERGQVRCLKGNHELGYMYPDNAIHTGPWIQSGTMAHILTLRNKMFTHLEDFIYKDDILITHAGLSQGFFRAFGMGADTVTTEWLEDMCSDLHGPMYSRSHARGGGSKYGGIFWCDWFWDFAPIDGLTQILGHTGVSAVLTKGDHSYNIDCASTSGEVLDVRDDKITIVQVKT